MGGPGAGEGHWIDPDLVEEFVDVDGHIRLRTRGETFDDETPWSATWEATLSLAAGEHCMELSLASPSEGIRDAMLFDDGTISLPSEGGTLSS